MIYHHGSGLVGNDVGKFAACYDRTGRLVFSSSLDFADLGSGRGSDIVQIDLLAADTLEERHVIHAVGGCDIGIEFNIKLGGNLLEREVCRSQSPRTVLGVLVVGYRTVVGDLHPVIAVLAQRNMEFGCIKCIVGRTVLAQIGAEREAEVLLCSIERDLPDHELVVRAEQQVIDTRTFVFRIVVVRGRVGAGAHAAERIGHCGDTRAGFVLPALELIQIRPRLTLTSISLRSLLLVEVVGIDRVSRGGGRNAGCILLDGHGGLGLTPFAELGVDQREGDLAAALAQARRHLRHRYGDRGIALAAHRLYGSPVQIGLHDRPLTVGLHRDGLNGLRLLGEGQRLGRCRQFGHHRLLVVIGTPRKHGCRNEAQRSEQDSEKMFTHKNLIKWL